MLSCSRGRSGRLTTATGGGVVYVTQAALILPVLLSMPCQDVLPEFLDSEYRKCT